MVMLSESRRTPPATREELVSLRQAVYKAPEVGYSLMLRLAALSGSIIEERLETDWKHMQPYR
jgi:hypothetical protein